MNTKKYISAVEAISLLAYGETKRLSIILAAEANYRKWKIPVEPDSGELLASFQRLAKGRKAKSETDMYAASLVCALKKKAQALHDDLEHDIYARREYPFNPERIAIAQNLFIETISSERLPIYGARRNGTGNIEEIPKEFTRRPDYEIDICRNTFCFKRTRGQPISKENAGEAIVVDEWKSLQVWEEDVRKIIPSEIKTSSPLGRPSPKAEIERQLKAMPSDAEFWKSPRKKQAEIITESCGKKEGDRGWGSRAVQNHISRYEKAVS